MSVDESQTAPRIGSDGTVLHVPIPPSRADEIYPGLWVGACARDAGGRTDPNRYDRVLTLCSATEETPLAAPTPIHYRYRMRDGADLPPVEDLALLTGWVIDSVQAGEQVLLRCWAGLNRSGLVAAVALIELTGLPGATALQAMRRQRSPHMLCNPAFAALVGAIPVRDPSGATA